MPTARIAALAMALVASACASHPDGAPAPEPASAPAALFAPEPTQHATFVGLHPFAAGTRLSFGSRDMKPEEQLRLNRCGNQCALSKTVGSWNKADFDRSATQDIVLVEPGDYYLWIRKELPDGEMGPVQAVSSTVSGNLESLNFASGTHVSVISGIDAPPGRAKLQSAEILARARRGQRQALLVEIDPGEAARTLLRRSTPRNDPSIDPEEAARRPPASMQCMAALHDAKVRMLEPLRAAGVDWLQDFDAMTVAFVALSSQSALRALLAAPGVTFVQENGRVELQ